MKYAIKKISPHSAGKISGAMLGCFSLIFWPIMFFVQMAAKATSPNVPFPPSFHIFLLLFPIIYGIMGYIMTAIMCLLYNFLSKFVGHLKIEMEVEQVNA